MVVKIFVLFLLASIFSAPATVFAVEEAWYTYWAVGTARHEHPGELNSTAKMAESTPGVSRSETSLDVLGFYWPFDVNQILGFVVSNSNDSYRFPNFTISIYPDLEISQDLYGLSTMKFFGSEIGDGFFLRGDVGVATISLYDSAHIRIADDTGYGYLLGAGYGIPVFSESRILISLNYSEKFVDGDKWTSMTFNIGGLW
jgi:hypothetical protein